VPGDALAHAVGTAGVAGVVGVGAMGLPIAQRLRDGGYAVCAHDIDPERLRLAAAAGIEPLADAGAVAARCEVLVVAVVDAAQTRSVLFDPRQGAAAKLRAGGAVLLCPTIAPADVEHCAAELGALGIDCIDAPMSGGPARARDGTMSLMVAAPDAVCARHEPLLRHLASRLFRVGERPGDGARTKLVNNLLAAINLAGAAEAMALAVRLGLDPATTLSVVEASSGQSWIGSERLRRAIAGDERVLARVALLAKDSALALAAAGSAGGAATLPLGAAAASVFAEAAANGLADADDASLWRRALAAWPPAQPRSEP
jgi:L-threonate 2-dehydrogenase